MLCCRFSDTVVADAFKFGGDREIVSRPRSCATLCADHVAARSSRFQGTSLWKRRRSSWVRPSFRPLRLLIVILSSSFSRFDRQHCQYLGVGRLVALLTP